MTPTRLPGSEPRTAAGRLAIAIVVSALVVLSAPFLGQIRAALRSAFPGHFVLIVGGAVALALAALFGAALTRVRDRRAARYALMAASATVAVIYSLATSSGIPEVDVVERVHFVQYGLLAYLFYAAWRLLGDTATLVLPVLAAFIAGTVDEWFQWFIPNRVGEARDVVLNLVAILCGLAFGVALYPPDRFVFALGHASRRTVGIVGATGLVVFAGFTHSVHLGHVVRSPEAGEFRSRYTHEELQRLAGDRAERWRHDPPLVLRRLSREDQYLDEGLWHVRARNRKWSEGDYLGAWSENRILEAYFEPVLDTRTYTAPTLHRWPTEQRADAEQRAAAATSGQYVSAAEPYPILTWPRPIYWAGVLLLAVTILGWSHLGRSLDRPKS